jgi:hypothetical protein
MFHSSDDIDTSARPMGVVDKFRQLTSRIAATLGTTRASVQKLDVAYASRCKFASYSAEEFRDTGVDPSDATGIASWQADLPFFLQSGFGRK